MRHQCAHRKFSRTSTHRKAMLRNMVTSFFSEEKFETTLEKAKDLRSVAEKLITLAADGSLSAKRNAYSYIMDKDVVHKLFAELGPRFKSRNGGYTRVVRTGFRHGDAAQMAIIELVERTAKYVPTKKEKKKEQEGAESASA